MPLGSTAGSLATVQPDARAGDKRDTSIAADLRDLRLLLLLGFTILVCLAFHFIFTDGYVLTPRNLSTLSVQMTVTAILAIGMTLLLIAREIDLSAGAVLAVVIVAIFQFQVSADFGTPLTVVLALAFGAAIGLLHGLIRVWLLIPSFIITLAGFSWIRGVALPDPRWSNPRGRVGQLLCNFNSEVPPGLSGIMVPLLAAYPVWAVFRTVMGTRGQADDYESGLDRPTCVGLGVRCSGLRDLHKSSRHSIPHASAGGGCCRDTLDHAFDRLRSPRLCGRRQPGGEQARRDQRTCNHRIAFCFYGASDRDSSACSGVIAGRRSPRYWRASGAERDQCGHYRGTNLFGGQGSVPGAVAGALLMASLSTG